MLITANDPWVRAKVRCSASMHRQGQTLPGRGLIDAMQHSKSIKATKSYFAYQATAITNETPSHQSLWLFIGQENNKVCEVSYAAVLQQCAAIADASHCGFVMQSGPHECLKESAEGKPHSCNDTEGKLLHWHWGYAVYAAPHACSVSATC